MFLKTSRSAYAWYKKYDWLEYSIKRDAFFVIHVICLAHRVVHLVVELSQSLLQLDLGVGNMQLERLMHSMSIPIVTAISRL